MTNHTKDTFNTLYPNRKRQLQDAHFNLIRALDLIKLARIRIHSPIESIPLIYAAQCAIDRATQTICDLQDLENSA